MVMMKQTDIICNREVNCKFKKAEKENVIMQLFVVFVVLVLSSRRFSLVFVYC